jgi:hypothetical protein
MAGHSHLPQRFSIGLTLVLSLFTRGWVQRHHHEGVGDAIWVLLRA